MFTFPLWTQELCFTNCPLSLCDSQVGTYDVPAYKCQQRWHKIWDIIFSNGQFSTSTELGNTCSNTHSLLIPLLQRMAQADSCSISMSPPKLKAQKPFSPLQAESCIATVVVLLLYRWKVKYWAHYLKL